MNYTEQMKNVFKIADFPAYPSTGNPAKDAEMFAGQFRQVTVLRSDPVYYTDHAAGVSEPSFFLVIRSVKQCLVGMMFWMS